MTDGPGAASTRAAPAVFTLAAGAPEAPPPPAPPDPTETPEWSRAVLRQNAVWFCQLRWIVVAILALAGTAGFLGSRLEQAHLNLRPALPLGAAGVLGVLNVAYILLARRLRRQSAGIPERSLLWTQTVTDLLLLTVVIHWLGSTLPWPPYTYLFHIILACIVLTPGESLLVVALAAGLYTGCLLLEVRGVLPSASIFTGTLTPPPPGWFLAYNLGGMLVVWLVIWHLVSRLAGRLRRREHELAATNLRLEASCDERAAHMLQTTHQLKAPFAAIHAQTQLLLGGYCGELPPKARETLQKISVRCRALAQQIREMLQLANLRSQGQAAPVAQSLELDRLLETLIAQIEPAARQRGIRIERDLKPVTVEGVEDHLTMMFDNLLVNAVNYSHDDGRVEVRCRPLDDQTAEIVIRDEGIGIPAEKLPHIFEDYYRTDEALKHNRSSTGLGLAIVRQVAREAGATLRVESAPGRGTTFTLLLPRRSFALKS
jgi:signal transduction histidine kinase